MNTISDNLTKLFTSVDVNGDASKKIDDKLAYDERVFTTLIEVFREYSDAFNGNADKKAEFSKWCEERNIVDDMKKELGVEDSDEIVNVYIVILMNYYFFQLCMFASTESDKIMHAYGEKETAEMFSIAQAWLDGPAKIMSENLNQIKDEVARSEMEISRMATES